MFRDEIGDGEGECHAEEPLVGEGEECWFEDEAEGEVFVWLADPYIALLSDTCGLVGSPNNRKLPDAFGVEEFAVVIGGV